VFLFHSAVVGCFFSDAGGQAATGHGCLLHNSITLYEKQFKKCYEQLYAQTQPLYMYKHTSRAATLQYILPRRKLILIPE
jgi:hypothetical protein